MHRFNKLNISHQNVENKDIRDILKEAGKSIRAEKSPEIIDNFSLEERLDVLRELANFQLGKFFLTHKGADAFWTDYIINYPFSSLAKKQVNLEGNPLSRVERFILEEAPLTLAHRERFKIFQNFVQNHLFDNIVLASIPCGCMRDLLELNYNGIKNFNLIGVDIDPNSLMLARELADICKINTDLVLKELDAWKVCYIEKIDILVSNGLNVYESDKNKLLKLYKIFYSALKPEGKLVVGFLTYPPDFVQKSEWNLNAINPKSILFEKLLYKSIIKSNWLNFKTSEEMVEDLLFVGFKKVDVIYDKYRIFPTAIALK